MKQVIIATATLLILFFIFNPAQAATQPGSSEFNTGVKYFKKKKYRTSLKYFLQAKKAGLKTPVLYYNLGVTHYKIGNYRKSESYFRYLTRKKNFRQVAWYNLGLIAEKQNNKKHAISLYQKAARSGKNEKITALAKKQIRRLTNRTAGYASVSLALGSDDNITNATQNSATNKSDNYSEIFAYFKMPLTQRLNLKGTLLSTDYMTANTEDFRFISAGLDYSSRYKNWSVIPELGLLQSTLGGNSYQSILDLKLSAKRRFDSQTRLDLRYRFSNITSLNTAYNYLQGSRQQLRADYKKKTATGRLRFRYQLETNNRQNSATANYSPVRHTFRIRYKHTLANKWKLSEELGYRISQYGAATNGTRLDNRLRLRLIASKAFSKTWHAGLRYTYTSNNSNFNTENYTRNNFQIFASANF